MPSELFLPYRFLTALLKHLISHHAGLHVGVLKNGFFGANLMKFLLGELIY
jgi:hypothetical protein